jgi:hypothetical protein
MMAGITYLIENFTGAHLNLLDRFMHLLEILLSQTTKQCSTA